MISNPGSLSGFVDDGGVLSLFLAIFNSFFDPWDVSSAPDPWDVSSAQKKKNLTQGPGPVAQRDVTWRGAARLVEVCVAA